MSVHVSLVAQRLLSASDTRALTRWLREAVAAKGYFFTVCSDPFDFVTVGKSHATLALLLFAFSKIPELGDTAFLILRGKPVRFVVLAVRVAAGSEGGGYRGSNGSGGQLQVVNRGLWPLMHPVAGGPTCALRAARARAE